MNAVLSNVSRDRQSSETGVSVVNALIGIWLIISPFVMTAFNHFQNAIANNVIVGILVALCALLRISSGKTAWSWCNVVLGIWMIISSFVLGLSSSTVAMWHNVIAGAVIAVLAWSAALFTHPMPRKSNSHMM
jgi:hypothetical protein